MKPWIHTTNLTVARYNPSTLNVDVFAAYRFTLLGRKNTLQLNLKNLTKQSEFAGWVATGSNKLATARYEVPVKAQWYVTYSIDL